MLEELFQPIDFPRRGGIGREVVYFERILAKIEKLGSGFAGDAIPDVLPPLFADGMLGAGDGALFALVDIGMERKLADAVLAVHEGD